jgi:hypothetical protein
MKYLKRYEQFLDETLSGANKNIDSRLMIIERSVLNDFSGSFWEMSMNSSVFTNEEKKFIKENLTTYKVDLVNEGWFGDMITKVYTKAKEKGKDVFAKIKEKIIKIKDGIKSLVGGIADFIKNFLSSLAKTATSKVKPLHDKVKDAFPAKIKETFSKKKPDPKELDKEIGELKSTYEFLKAKLSSMFSGEIDKVDDKVMSDAEAEVQNLESELQLESFDILGSFYIKEADEFKEGEKVKYKRDNGDEVEKEILRIEGDKIFFKDKDGNEFSKPITDVTKIEGEADKKDEKSLGGKAKDWFMKWFLDMEKSSPPEEGGKAKWWIKLILKIISLVLSPVVKTLEVAVKFIVSNVCKGVSIIINKIGGPGIFEFLILGGIVAGLPALSTEISLVNHEMPEPWSHIFEVVSHFLKEVTGLKSLLTIFGAFCTFMTFYQLVIEFNHSLHSVGASEHGTPAAKPAVVTKPEAKPVENTKPEVK